MTYNETFDYINVKLTKGSVYGLSRIKELLKRLSNPEKDLHIIHIAGTNGKGSISRIIMSVLAASGYNAGVFNSPFLEKRNEYLCINGRDCSDLEYSFIFGEVKNAVEGTRLGLNPMNEKPTEFEFSFAMAMEYFSRKGCDFAIVECGLGGLSDATNVFENKELSIIANIGLDHTKLLGDTLKDIAKQKAGIIIKNDTVIAYPSDPEALRAVKYVCKKMNAELITPHYITFGKMIYYDLGSKNFIFDMCNLPSLIDSLNLKGEFQKINAMVALAAILTLKNKGFRKINLKALINGFKSVVWPGRFETLCTSPLVIADGGHNTQCAKALIESLDKLGIKKAIFVIGIMADKDYNEVFRIISPYVHTLIATEPSNPRRLSAEDICSCFKSVTSSNKECTISDFIIEKSPFEAVKKAIVFDNEKYSLNMPVIITGSLYMMADIRNAAKTF